MKNIFSTFSQFDCYKFKFRMITFTLQFKVFNIFLMQTTKCRNGFMNISIIKLLIKSYISKFKFI